MTEVQQPFGLDTLGANKKGPRRGQSFDVWPPACSVAGSVVLMCSHEQKHPRMEVPRKNSRADCAEPQCSL